MKTSAILGVLDMADSTLRKYAVEYAHYLSPSATRGAGTHRDYTNHDVRVLKLINDMKRAKQSDEDIEVTLSSLEAGGWERLPALDESSSAIIPAPAAMIAAHGERAVMQKEIDMLRDQLEGSKAERDDRDARIVDLERKLSR
ncbi:MAG: MerR family transcriptional regulator, partial [Chloroflexota bacterium]